MGKVRDKVRVKKGVRLAIRLGFYYKPFIY